MWTMPEPRFWVNTVSRDHVRTGVAGGFTQADHGRNGTIRQLRRGEWLAFYSPKTAFRDGDPLQSFTAIGRVADDEPYPAEMTPTFCPWRRRVHFEPDPIEAPIRPLIHELAFIADKRRWGFPFRRGLFCVPDADFARITAAMGVALTPTQTAALR